MDLAKVRLSEEEIKLVASRDFILTKNRIMQKAYDLLLVMQHSFQSIAMQTNPPTELLSIPPKISRGEQYEGLPYLVLDLPRNFGKPDILAIRTMFWWGESFSMTLVLAGAFQRRYAKSIERIQKELIMREYKLGVHADIWQHHNRDDNFLAVASFDDAEFASHIHHHAFIKLSRTYELTAWEALVPEMEKDFAFLLQLLKDGKDD